MKRKHIAILIILGVVCLLLPFVIDLIYDVGETFPVCYTRYSASDVLSYIATVIGLMLSVIAIILSLQNNELHIKVKHSHTVTKDNKEGIYYEIINDSLFDCLYASIPIANRKSKCGISFSLSSGIYTILLHLYPNFLMISYSFVFNSQSITPSLFGNVNSFNDVHPTKQFLPISQSSEI